MQIPSNPTHPISTSSPAPRLFAISDVHVDIQANRAWLHALSAAAYRHDTLILAGDVSDNLAVLRDALTHLCGIFAHVCFVPGNHELWVRKREYVDSIAKFHQIQHLCDALGVHTRPIKVGATHADGGVWVVPLFSWYIRPEEGSGSLFKAKPGEDPTLSMWSDTHFTRWPRQADGQTPAAYFLELNKAHLTKTYDAPIISFSHFLPRMELIYSTPEERRAAGVIVQHDPHPTFNFSRVAGCTGIEDQIRRLGAMTHVYGHQHRNRDRVIDGVRYVSHCLGYPRERQKRSSREQIDGPFLVWTARGV
ncbi:MAG TPA: metallophosphoesterase family protein [Candidatus Entotheonella sp.]